MSQLTTSHISLCATALALFVACEPHAAAAQGLNQGTVPPIVPAADEVPIRGVPAFSIHLELEQCLKDAAALLGGENSALHVHISTTQRYYSPGSGFVLRADFSRDDVLPPLVNRIVCWHTGQLIASRISAQPLSREQAEKALAVPRANGRQN